MGLPLALARAALPAIACLVTLSVARAEEGVDTFGPFHLVADQPGVLALEGPLVGGTAGAFLWALQTAGVPDTLLLSSDGGVVEDALVIADMIRVLRIATEIPEGSRCASACVLLFFAGVGRQANGELGLHEFVEHYPDLPPVPNPALTAVSEQALLRFGTPREIVRLAWATPYNRFHILTPDEAAALGANRTREEGLALAAAEDLSPVLRPVFDANLPLEDIGPPVGGATLTLREPGATPVFVNGLVQWAVGRDQGSLRARVEFPELGVVYAFILIPVGDLGDYVDAEILIVKLGTEGQLPVEPAYEFAVGLTIDVPGVGSREVMSLIATIRQVFGPSVQMLKLSRLLHDMNFDRFRAANAFRVSFSVDGTLDHTITIDFDVNADGRAAIAEALALWGS